MISATRSGFPPSTPPSRRAESSFPAISETNASPYRTESLFRNSWSERTLAPGAIFHHSHKGPDPLFVLCSEREPPLNNPAHTMVNRRFPLRIFPRCKPARAFHLVVPMNIPLKTRTSLAKGLSLCSLNTRKKIVIQRLTPTIRQPAKTRRF